jgi:RNA polymerase sigma factor (sigma-70 family)
MEGVFHHHPERGTQVQTTAMIWVDWQVNKWVRNTWLRGLATEEQRAPKRIVGLYQIYSETQSLDEYVAKAQERFPSLTRDELENMVIFFSWSPRERVHVGNPDQSPDAEPDPEEQISELESERLRLRAVRAAMAALPEKHRQVVQWTILEGETLAAVGQWIGLSKERVRQIRDEAVDMMQQDAEVRRAA